MEILGLLIGLNKLVRTLEEKRRVIWTEEKVEEEIKIKLGEIWKETNRISNRLLTGHPASDAVMVGYYNGIQVAVDDILETIGEDRFLFHRNKER